MSGSGLSERVEAWRDQGGFTTFRDYSIYRRRGEGEGQTILFLHGFPTSSFDFAPVIERLAGLPTLSFDFLGYGLSEKPRDHSYTIAWQADLTEALVAELGDGPVFVCAHDLGTSVATELMARDLEDELGFEMTGVLLFNGSILIDRAQPTLAQKLLRGPIGPLAARLSNEAFFRRQFSSVFSEAHPPSPEELEDAWSLIANNGGSRLGHKLVYYMEERSIYADRWHGAVRDWSGPLSLAWGLEDPVAVPAILEGLLELRPGVEPFTFPDLGHYPQVEDPDRFSEALVAARASGAKTA
ncbi:MAG: alpha/beta fold hydrolase [Solirubrobacterales bacterium]